MRKNKYRTHYCGELTKTDIDSQVRISGWVENIRDHGGIIFLDIRDQYGTIQIVGHDNHVFDNITRESTVTVAGKVILRDKDMINPRLKTGDIEILVDEIKVQGPALNELPFEIMTSLDVHEDIRLKYRYLDLRNKKVHDNIVFRSEVISFLRTKMTSLGFTEIQTPILTASSPEGARDYIVPSRKYHGKFYALPQAPQIFKQLLMVSGFDRYFQIAPCFRDEDARSDRSPGEFYQLDFEMAFAEAEDVYAVTEEVLHETFTKFSDKEVSSLPFRRIPYKEAMLKYGSDKPDLRNPLEIIDLTDVFKDTTFKPFSGVEVRGITVKNIADKSNSWFNELGEYATNNGLAGLGYLKVNDDMSLVGPIDKFLTDEERKKLIERCNLSSKDVLFFIADSKKVNVLAGTIRMELGRRLDLIDNNRFEFCFIVDFPMYEYSEEEEKYIFTHNPFSMPQGGMDSLLNKKPEEILAYQYDIVCNGVELSSGAVRNHDIEIMKKAFEIVGYDEEVLKTKFKSLYTAFQYGAPPHAGMAPGIDRIIMLLKEESNIREVIAFPMNSSAQDLMMGSPSEVTEQQLRDVHIKIR
ncbi:MAG: aspartate--tRNA ligase [Bacilli bacterium]|nr:aspartate--tRNA ligase [Bacilli bacterium]MDD4808610.1 aspartate--tRNA ligase [Bacilli bacterium]